MATQQYREVKRKAAVGERIRVVKASYTMGRYDNGDEFTVNHVDRDDDVYVSIEGKERLICLSEFVVLEPVTQPIAPSSLQSDPLYAAFLQFVADNADGIRAILPEVEALATQTPAQLAPVKPLTRADVIAKARADVAEMRRVGQTIFTRLDGDSPFSESFFTVKFHVNRDKRAVTALVYKGRNHQHHAATPDAKFTAKCSPADVFHAEIGKVIALRKALGLAVPSEYTDAPQPDGKNANMIVRYEGKTRKLVPSNLAVIHGETAHIGSIIGKRGTILDDTDVDYGAVSAKGVAA